MTAMPLRLFVAASEGETAVLLQALHTLWPDAPMPEIVGPDQGNSHAVLETCQAAFVSPSQWMEQCWSDDPATRQMRVEALMAQAQVATGEDAQAITILTLYRHIAPAERDRLLPRLRKLNLLMAELAHASGAYVCDLDRLLATTGAVSHGADWRLSRPLAQDHAARAMAQVLLLTGLAERIGRDRTAAEQALKDWTPATLGNAPQVEAPAMAVLPGSGDGRAILAQVREGWLSWRVLPVLAGRFLRRARQQGLGAALAEVKRRF